MRFTVEQLEQAGGKYWESADHSKRRAYFNDLHELAGLEIETYNTGNISSAVLNGETISNSAARKLASKLQFAKIYYDFATEKFAANDIDNDLFRTIVANIKTRLEV